MGGIKHGNATSVVASGADRVAVVTAITQADDVARAAAELKDIVLRARMARSH
jgi:thiamine-phosphate pyrophosphorylase